MSQMNNWEVLYSTIRFVEDMLEGHSKVSSFTRHNEILFTIERNNYNDEVIALLVNRYTLSHADIIEAKSEFPSVTCIVTSEWNSYTDDAKDYGKQNGIGVFQMNEFIGALWYRNIIDYVPKDRN